MKLGEDPMVIINRRRRQLHVHSIIYYHMGQNLIDDATFDAWANELTALQASYPESKHKGYLPSVFEDWNGNTGMHLPMREEVIALAESLVRLAEKKNWTPTATQKPDAWKGDVGYRVN